MRRILALLLVIAMAPFGLRVLAQVLIATSLGASIPTHLVADKILFISFLR